MDSTASLDLFLSNDVMLIAKGKRRLYKWIIPIIAIVLIVCLITLIAIIMTKKANNEPTLISEKMAAPDTISCPGFSGGKCETAEGCLYDPSITEGPSCSMLKDRFGFKVENVLDNATRYLVQEDDGPLIKLKSIKEKTPYGPSLKNVVFKATYVTENILRFQFKDAENERYEVPVQKEFPLLQNPSKVNFDNLTYKVVHSKESETFNFAVIRKSDGTVLWNTSLGALLLSDQFLQIGSYLPTSNIYGLGEHVHHSLRHDMNFRSWPMFSRDEGANPKKSANLYGVHPFYTCLETSGASHGVLFLNSNAMEAMMIPAPGIIFRTVGGILDFFVFVGDNPEHVIQLYTSLVGRPVMPPYWSLGFQLSRWGYDTTSKLKEVVDRNRKAKIPQEVQFLDIDHFEKRMDFTYDNSSFEGLPEYVNEEKKTNGLKWIIILDPGISAVDNYEPYTSGLDKSVFVNRAPSWSPDMFPSHLREPNVTYGKVWPPYPVAFPDFFRKETGAWWKEQIVKHKKTINFDGLWIDMNEPANFDTNVRVPELCKGKSDVKTECWNLVCPKTPLEDPPYNPQEDSGFPRLSTKTLCMESVQGENGSEYLHYDVHSLYGWSQTRPTLESAQEATGTRSLVISRSTYPSSGRYAGTWLGDNNSEWTDLKVSIIGMLEYNMFGIPYVGADVCGFFGSASEDLCKRWMQLGAFYPFYRNHNTKDSPDQDPAFFGPKMAEISRKAIERRITLNPYLYTLFYRAHVDGNTVVRPVFHEFPTDENTWNYEKGFMWGKSLLIAPITDPNVKTVLTYLPKGEWWKFNYEKTTRKRNAERWISERDADEYTPVYVRGGSILPIGIYDPDEYPEDKKNSTRRRMNLYVFPYDRKAEGELFMDDGISKDTIENQAYAIYKFTVINCTLEIDTTEYKNFKGPDPFLEKIFVFKVKSASYATYNFRLEMNKQYKMATIIIQTEMRKLKEMKWSALNKACEMED